MAQALLDKGVTWKKGKVFFDTRAVYEFDLLPESGHRMPAFINLQQYYFEHACIAAAAKTGLIDLRWQEEVQGLEHDRRRRGADHRHPERALSARGRLGDRGRRGALQRATAMGLGFEGRVFQDQFLICDIKMRMERPAERWFWFDPPFNRGRSALLHAQADDVWRLDFQVGDEADRDEEVKPENVARRVRAMLGEDIDFTFEWISLYRFQSRRLQRFRHGRVLFAGDAAHQMSPFGARGGNSGVQDADNLGWKLDLVLRGLAPERLLDSYDAERILRCRREPAQHHALDRLHRAEERNAAECFATACWRWPRPSRSRAGWSTRAGCRRPPATTARRSMARTVLLQARRRRCVPAPRRSMRRSMAAGCCIASAGASPASGSAPTGISPRMSRARRPRLRSAPFPSNKSPLFHAKQLAPATAPSATRLLPVPPRRACGRALATSGARRRGSRARSRDRHILTTVSRYAMALQREANSKDPDGLYAAIIEAHAGLSDADSAALNARLVLLLANHIGDESVLREALVVARKSIGK